MPINRQDLENAGRYLQDVFVMDAKGINTLFSGLVAEITSLVRTVFAIPVYVISGLIHPEFF